MSIKSVKQLKTVTTQVKDLAEAALKQGNGILRLAPNWVPRSFLHPGRRLKLHPMIFMLMGLSAVALMNGGLPLRRKRPMRGACPTRA